MTSQSDDPGSRLAGLLEVARVVNSSLELDAVLEQILGQGRDILVAESGSIMLVDNDTGSLAVLAAFGPRAHRVRGRSQPATEGVAGWVYSRGAPVLLHGATQDGRFQRAQRSRKRQDVRDALCAPLVVEEEVIGVMSLNNHVGQEPFSEADLQVMIALSHQAAVAIRNARSYEEMRRQRRTVERLLHELTRAQEEERRRIAMQIHDGPAQTMFAALRHLEAVRVMEAAAAPNGSAECPGDESPQPSALRDSLEDVERIIRAAIRETRGLMLDLRPPVLDELGLLAALREYAREFEQRTGITTRVEGRGRTRRLPSAVESSFYRIAQEALVNVWKHSGARWAKVVLDVGSRSCLLEVRDDGNGFDPQEAIARRKKHMGLASLQDRSDLVGGQVTIDSAPGRGACIRVQAPLTD